MLHACESGHACCLPEIRRDVVSQGLRWLCWLGDEVLPSSGRLISPQEVLMCDSLTKGLQSSQVVGGLQDSRLQGEFSILLQLLVFSCQSWEAP